MVSTKYQLENIFYQKPLHQKTLTLLLIYSEKVYIYIRKTYSDCYAQNLKLNEKIR